MILVRVARRRVALCDAGQGKLSVCRTSLWRLARAACKSRRLAVLDRPEVAVTYGKPAVYDEGHRRCGGRGSEHCVKGPQRRPRTNPRVRRTRERVHAIARELGYRPHPFARALRGAPTMLLGAVVRDITDPFFAGAIEALSIEAKERGYSVVLGHARANADEAIVLTGVLEARQCDAVVLLGDFRGEPRLVEDLRNADVRVVALWHGSQTYRSHPFPTVTVDNRAGIRGRPRTRTSALEHH